jgi:NNP family nitrate/nitrite transporter-like MFS transporter
MWLPLIVIASVCAWFFMDSLGQARTDRSSYVHAIRHPQTWVMSLLYVGTFGSFIGFSFAMPLVIKNTFPEFLSHHPFIAVYLAGLGFLGALLGSLSRPAGGWLSDRIGGARVTFGVFAGMAIFTALAIFGVQRHSFAGFFASYLIIFVLTGIGNGSTYKMIPSIFANLGREAAVEQGLAPDALSVEYKRRAAAVIGVAGSVGALGGAAIQLVLRQSSLQVSSLLEAARTPAEKAGIASSHAAWSVPALWVFLVSYVVLGAVTWAVYLRRSEAHDLQPAPAGA